MEKLNIYQKILAIMAEVDYIQKGEKKVNNQYRFVSHDQVAEVFHKQFVKHRILAIPTVKSYSQDGNRTECVLEVRFINVDDPKEDFTVESFGYGIDTGDKGPGKAYSYSYKYCLLKTFCLETGDDPDQDQQSDHTPTRPELKPVPLTSAQINWVKKVLANTGIKWADLTEIHGGIAIEEMLQIQLPAFKRFVEGK